MKVVISLVGMLVFCCSVQSQQHVNFNSLDGLELTSDYYAKQGATTFILLFHQAGWSRGEYSEIAPKLNAMGYACMAVDLRSGGAVNGVVNETHRRAKGKGMATAYKDALKDIEAAVNFVKTTYKPEKLILWGSSYSSALVLKYGGDHPTEAQAIVSFAPGEYFGSKSYIADSAEHIVVPTFITSAKNEHKNWKAIHAAIPGTQKKSYLPETAGNHGSRALWEKFNDHSGYWEAVSVFLKAI